MAAPSGIVWGSIANSKGRIGIYTSASNTTTKTTVTVEVWVWTRYSCYDSSNSFYFSDNATSATTGRGSVDFSHTSNSSWSTSNQTKIYTYSSSYSRATSNKTVYCAAKLTGIDWVDGTMTAAASYTIPALTKYTVAYNANGGSGAPSSQTKYYGITLKLSNTKPTRTGYSFLGWNTSSTATSAAYSAGANYTANAGATLYAVWKANTYTVAYNANGGSGAPSSQKKTYGVSLKLSRTKPTRTNYNFLGWGTSASAKTAKYAAGGTYTSNAAITLYAVWELAYTKPKITGISIYRVNGNISTFPADDFGRLAAIKFSWACDETQGTNNIYTATLAYKLSTDTSWTTNDMTPAQKTATGNVSTYFGGGTLSTESSYDVKITVTDSKGGSTTVTRTLSAAVYPIDFLTGGKGTAIGKPAARTNTFEVAWPSRFNDTITTVNNKGLYTYLNTGTNCNLIIRNDSNNIWIGDASNTSQGDIFLATTDDGNAYVSRNNVRTKILDYRNVFEPLFNGSMTTSSGAVAIPGISKYYVFMIYFDNNTPLIAVRNGNYIRGVGGYSTGSMYYAAFCGLTLNGDNTTYVDVGYYAVSGSSKTITGIYSKKTLTKIWGLLGTSSSTT